MLPKSGQLIGKTRLPGPIFSNKAEPAIAPDSFLPAVKSG